MSKDTPVNKRVKRHVIGREQLFFVATPPALARLCKSELENLLAPENELQSQPGGFEFKGRLNDAYRVNLLSRLSNRVLMQLTSFKATSFRRLEQKLAELPWELYLYGESAIKIRVNTRKCRLYHSSAVAERVEEKVQRHLAQFGLPEAKAQSFDLTQQLFVKGNNDHFSVSIDSSGDHLYKRGLKTHGGRAPLRENLAAAVLQLAGYDGREPLVDPMCGSGTFSLEAALNAAGIPPGWFREFAFMQWPSFIHRRWNYLRSQHESENPRPANPLILAADTDSSACERLRQCVQKNAMGNAVTVVEKDFFKLQPTEWTEQKGLVVLNPPYGRRIKKKPADESLLPILDRLKDAFNGWRYALIAPRQQLAAIRDLPMKTYPLTHGGLRVAVGTGQIP